MIELFPVSFGIAVDLLELLGDFNSEAVPMAVVEFKNDNDAIHYRLRWEDAYHLADTVWTIPPGTSAISWIAENSPDSDLGEWEKRGCGSNIIDTAASTT